MNTFFASLLLLVAVNFSAYSAPDKQSDRKDHPTKLARYQAGVFLAASGTKLHVYVDKQLGGQVTIQLMDLKSKLYYDQTMTPMETTARLSLDLTALLDGDYRLKVSNGLEVIVREIKIATPRKIVTPRSITLQ